MAGASDFTSESLLARISKERPKGRVCFVPNFSLDLTLNTERSFSSLVSRMRKVYRNGGGNVIDDSIAEFSLGGCSAISAHCLAMLGGRSYFVGETSSFGKSMLSYFFEKSGAKMYVKERPKIPFSLVFEVGKSNLMFSDAMEYSSADARVFDIVRRSRILSIQGYWAVIKPELAEACLRTAKSNGAVTYIDTSDPANFRKQMPRFLSLFSQNLVDVFSVNENEAIQYASHAEGRKISDPLEAAMALSDRLETEINLHATDFSAVCRAGKKKAHVASFQLGEVQRLTGAGDHWVGGNLYAMCIDLKPAQRLLFANAVSGYYMSHGGTPDLRETINFIQTHKLRRLRKR